MLRVENFIQNFKKKKSFLSLQNVIKPNPQHSVSMIFKGFVQIYTHYTHTHTPYINVQSFLVIAFCLQQVYMMHA